MIVRCSFLLLVFLIGCTPTLAQVGVAPIRVDFSQGRLNGAITISNDTDRTLTMQPTPMLWEQEPDGTDRLTPTRDVIAAPPLVEIPPKQKQVIRVALRAAGPRDKERHYRLLVREVQPERAQGQVALQFALHLSIPIFAYSPPNATTDGVEILAGRMNSSGSLPLTVKNHGPSHVQVKEVKLSVDGSAKAERVVMFYVLPSVSRTIEVPVPLSAQAAFLASKQLNVELVTTSGVVQRQIPIH